MTEKSEKTESRPPDVRNGLTARDLIEALGWHSQLAAVDNSLSEYWHLRFELLSGALGLPSGWSEDRAKTSQMLQPLAEETIHGGFFARFLEWTPLPGEPKIFRAHQSRIETAEACLRGLMLEYAEDLLFTFWPLLRNKSVRLEDLVAMGLAADQPDPIDFI